MASVITVKYFKLPLLALFHTFNSALKVQYRFHASVLTSDVLIYHLLEDTSEGTEILNSG